MHRHSIRSFLLMIALTFFAAACGGSVPDALEPDTILINGRIVTVDADFSIAEAVAIREDKFVAVGSNQQIQALAGAGTQVFDLEGKTVLPGFNDGHGHVTLTWGKKVDPIETKFRSAESIEEILDVLREKMETLGPDEILWFDRGPSSPSQFKENRWLNRHDLDKVSTDRPILLSLGPAGMHAIVNTKLMRDVGITRRTPQPSAQGLQGEIVKDRAGQPLPRRY